MHTPFASHHGSIAHVLLPETVDRRTRSAVVKSDVGVVKLTERSGRNKGVRSLVESSSRFLRACRRQPVDRTPVWFMRQAGRYMAEYRALRQKHTLLEICAQPELAAEVTLQPIKHLDVDAAIIFADLLPPLIPMGIDLEYAAGEGPVIHNPVRDAAAVERLRAYEPREHLAATFDAIRLVRRALPDSTSLIGFAGAPFTLASYMIEGGSSRNYLYTKQLMYGDPQIWDTLMSKLAEMTSRYLAAQIEAGADAVQIFDSWVGALSPRDYRRFVQPHVRQIVDRVKASGVPIILFGTGTAGILDQLAETGADVVGLDWRVGLNDGWDRVGRDKAIQGNLDPVLLFAPRDEIERQVRAILDEAAGRDGHIFNLGHGILPQTPVENVQFVTDLVHRLTERG
jgi:uroporphyrinogen decarboxylase